jgi:hypothetical protein
MAKEKAGPAGTSLATVDGAALATASADEFAVLNGLDLESDGLDEVGNEDFKIALKVWNFKGTTPDGEPVLPNQFFDTIDETVKKELNLVFLTLHKSKEWREYLEAEGKARVRCRSNDRAMGTMEDGTERPCQGCPDAQWRTDEKGKRGRNCGDVYGVVAIDMDTHQPATLRFKRTSLPVIQSHLQKHHIGKRVVAGQRLNVPLFQYAGRATLKMSDDKKYSIPVLERLAMINDAAMLQRFAAESKFFRDHILPIMDKVAEKDASADTGGSGGGSEGGTDFEFGANVEGGGGSRRFADKDMR